MSFERLLTSAVVAVLSTHAQTEDVSTEWEIEPHQGNATVLRREFDISEPRVEFRCEGKPPSFHILFLWPGESAAPSSDFERAHGGTIHIPPRPTRKAEWKGEGWFSTPLERTEVESLVETGAAVDIEVQAPDGEVIRYRSPESSTIAPAISKFLEYCAHHVKSVHRQFVVDGIEVDLQVEVDDKGLEDIRALAAELGIRDVQKVYVGPRSIRWLRVAAIVESRVVRDRDRIAQSKLVFGQKYWKHWPSSDVDSEEDLTTRGLWHADSRALQILDRWIIRDGDWNIEVRLGEGVPYDDAARLIRAIRAGTLVDVREGPRWKYIPLSAEPYELKQWKEVCPRIERDKTAAAVESGSYEISIPQSRGLSGTTLQVRIVGDRVEVVGVSLWIV